MAKRFTDTEKWRDPWFCSLTNQEKLFWIFLLDNCNLAGIWQVNWPIVRFYFPDFKFEEAFFKQRILILSEDKWFIKKFPFFQYGELQETNRMHQRIIYELKKEGVSKGYLYPSEGVKDKDKDKDKDKESLSLKSLNGFEDFWKAYPKKIGKDAAKKAWEKKRPPLEACLTALIAQCAAPAWVKEDGEFIPHPATWINQGRWNDEVKTEKREVVG